MELLFYFGTLSTGSRSRQMEISLTVGQQLGLHEPTEVGTGSTLCSLHAPFPSTNSSKNGQEHLGETAVLRDEVHSLVRE